MLARFIRLGTLTARPIISRPIIALNKRYFANVQWAPQVQEFLNKEGIQKPTDIQEKTLPHIVEGGDLVGVARTGSGKTLAFAVPAVMKILNTRENGTIQHSGRSKPSSLILSPTRELAQQIGSVFDKFRHLGIRSIVLAGGMPRLTQVTALERHPIDVFIATPGRLQDLVDSGVADLSQVNYLVFDEADRMLDMGFEPQIRKIVANVSRERQTLMWSATWPREVRELAKDFMKDYEYVAVDSATLKANPNIKQIIKVCQPRQKFSMLMRDFEQAKQECPGKPRFLIFSNMKRRVDMLTTQIMRNRMKVVPIHGDLSQARRSRSLQLFKDGVCDIMIATDVAARGLDIDNITHVINYDMPQNIEDYIHRIGRTARHEKVGTSISYITSEDENIVKKLKKVLRETNQDIPDELDFLM